MTEDDKPNIRLAKNCGGMDFCSDCRAEGELWRKEHPQQVEDKELAEAKLRHPSKYPKSSHEWFAHSGHRVIAWMVRDVLFHYAERKQFPTVFEPFADSLEIDATGKVLREVRPSSDFFQVLDETDWLVRDGNLLNVVKYRIFLETYSQTPVPAQPATSVVEHPSHYGGADNPYEAIKVIRAWDLGFELGNTVKYIARAGKKDPEKELEDLEKAAWYLQDFINWKKEQS